MCVCVCVCVCMCVQSKILTGATESRSNSRSSALLPWQSLQPLVQSGSHLEESSPTWNLATT